MKVVGKSVVLTKTSASYTYHSSNVMDNLMNLKKPARKYLRALMCCYYKAISSSHNDNTNKKQVSLSLHQWTSRL